MGSFQRYKVLRKFHVGLARGLSGTGQSSEQVLFSEGTIFDFDGSKVIVRDQTGGVRSQFEKPELMRLLQTPGYVEHLGNGEGPPQAGPDLAQVLASLLLQQQQAPAKVAPSSQDAPKPAVLDLTKLLADLPGLVAQAATSPKPAAPMSVMPPPSPVVQQGTKAAAEQFSRPVIQDHREIPLSRPMSVTASPSTLVTKAQVGAVPEIVGDSTPTVGTVTGKRFPVVRDEGGAVGTVVSKVATSGQAKVGQPSLQTTVQVGSAVSQNGMTLKAPSDSPVMASPVEATPGATPFRRTMVREDGMELQITAPQSRVASQAPAPMAPGIPSSPVASAKPRLSIEQVQQIIPGFEWDLSLSEDQRVRRAMGYPPGAAFLKGILRVEEPHVAQRITQAMEALEAL